MECPNCSHLNQPDAKFCSNCGHALPITCPVCSTVAQPGARFCSNCGASLEGGAPPRPEPTDDLTRYLPKELLAKMQSARAGHAMKGERRTVTMLFADIKGSTAAAEQLDPEDWAEIVNGAFEHLIAPVYRFEGTLAHLQGDAVLAFFGAPIAHEDDPVRALRAGLEIIDAIDDYSARVKERWGIPLEVRVGINTGLVVVGEVGSDLRVEYTALGDAINVAARMEQTASPGTVRVTAETHALTKGMFEVEDIGPVEVKGKSQPVNAVRVVSFRGFSGDTESGRPIVGRRDELALLDELHSNLEAGSGWIASIIGEAGVGKSRLVSEFHAHVTGADTTPGADGGSVFWMSGLSRSYDATTPYSVMRELLRRWWSPTASPSFEEVAESVADVGMDDPDAAALLGFIGGIDLPEEPRKFIDALETPVLQTLASEALLSYLDALSHAKPTIILLEDLHWADDLSLALTERIMDLTEGSPIGLLIVMRPYRDEPTWRIHEVAVRDHPHRYHHIDLGPLAPAAGTELMESLLDDVAVPEETKRRILERSDGNPLFIEQMLSSFKEAGPAELDPTSVPSSLTGILTARLDRLDDESKFVVQMASVLGSEFDRDTLMALLKDSTPTRQLIDLLRRGIFVEHNKPDMLGFRHALLQETAYSTILKRTRRELHQRVADHLIATRPDAVQDIARHLTESDVIAAFPYLVEAGMQASRSMALADAIQLFTTAIENLPSDADPELVERAHSGLGEAYSLVPNLTEASTSYQRLFEYGEREDRPAACVAALNNLGYATAALGFDLDKANSYLSEARQLAEDIGDDIGLAQYHMNSCLVASMAGQLGEAVAHDEKTVELGQKSGIDSIRLSGLVRRAINYTALLDLEKAREAIDSAKEAAEELEMEEGLAILATTSSLLRLAEGDFRGAIEASEGAVTTLARYASYTTAMDERNLGWLKYLVGDLDGALGHLVESRRIADRMDQPFVGGSALATMALVYATLGMPEPIPELRESALESTTVGMGEFMASSTFADLAFCELLLGEIAEAESTFDQGLDSMSNTRFAERTRLLCGRALTRVASGDFDGAAADLEAARAFAAEKSFRATDAMIAWAQGELHLGRGEHDQADASLSQAEAIAISTGELTVLSAIREARVRTARAAGDTAAETEFARAAAATFRQIADSISEDELRDSYTTRWLRDLEETTQPG